MMTLATLTPLLAWRPFLDPLPMDAYWLWFLLPLAAAIAVVYKAIKLDHLAELPRAAAALTMQILFFMALAAAALWVLTEIV